MQNLCYNLEKFKGEDIEMGLFHNLSKNNIVVKPQNKGLQPVKAEDVVRPIRKRYETELDRTNDANNKVNINMYFELVATYCAGAGKLILDGDFDGLRRLDGKYSEQVDKLDLIIAATKFDSKQEREMAEKTLSALKIMRDPSKDGILSMFETKLDGYKFITNLQTCCEFLGQHKPVDVMNKCADYGYFVNIVPILYHQIFDNEFKFGREHIYCKEILNLYDKIQEMDNAMYA